MFADAVLSAILKCESLQGSKIIALPTTVDNVRFKVRVLKTRIKENALTISHTLQECLIEMLQEMFGDESVPKVFKGDTFVVTVDGKKANIDISALVAYKFTIPQV